MVVIHMHNSVKVRTDDDEANFLLASTCPFFGIET